MGVRRVEGVLGAFVLEELCVSGIRWCLFRASFLAGYCCGYFVWLRLMFGGGVLVISACGLLLVGGLVLRWFGMYSG